MTAIFSSYFFYLALTYLCEFLSYYRWLFLLLDLDILRYDYRVPYYNYILTDNHFRSLESDKETYSLVQWILVDNLVKVKRNRFFDKKHKRKNQTYSKETWATSFTWEAVSLNKAFTKLWIFYFLVRSLSPFWEVNDIYL